MSLSLLVSHWEFSPSALVSCGVLGVVYAVAASRAAAWPARRTAAFVAGSMVILIALTSGIDSYDIRLLSVHMVQHLLLIDVAPPLLLLGAPARLALVSVPREHRVRFGRALTRLGHRLSPVLCLAIYSAIVLGSHVPVIFTAAIRHPLLHALQHAAYLLAGTVLWWPLLGSPNPRRLGPMGRLFYLTVAMLPMTLIGAYLNRDQTLFYPVYAAPARALGVNALLDQQVAGAIMWVASTVFMALLGLVCVMSALLAAERRQQARDLHGVTP